MQLFESVAELARLLRRIARQLGRLENTACTLEHATESLRQSVRVLVRAGIDRPSCTVMLLGTSTGAQRFPICAAWTGKLEPFELGGSERVWRADGLIRVPYSVASGAVLCSVSGAMLRSARVGAEEQFASNDSCGPVCVLRAIGVGLDVRFTLELKT